MKPTPKEIIESIHQLLEIIDENTIGLTEEEFAEVFHAKRLIERIKSFEKI